MKGIIGKQKQEFLTIEEVANKLRVHYNTIYRRIQNGTIKSIQIGRQHRIRVSDYEEYLRNAK